MEDPYFVSLGLRECGEAIHAAVTDSVTGELVDHYELTHPGGGTCVVAVYEKHYYRAGNWGAAESFEGVVHDALSRYRL